MRRSERGIPVLKTALNTDGDFDTNTDGVNMALYHRCLIMYTLTTTGASNTTVTLLQGTSSTCATAMGFTEYSKNEDCLTNLATFTKVTATTLTTAGPAAATHCYLFEVKSDQLNTDTINSENTFIRLNTTGSANVTAAQLTYIMYEPRFVKSTDGFPSVA